MISSNGLPDVLSCGLFATAPVSRFGFGDVDGVCDGGVGTGVTVGVCVGVGAGVVSGVCIGVGDTAPC